MRNKRSSVAIFTALLFLLVGCALAQRRPATVQEQPAAESGMKGSAAYAELILRKTDLESELDALLVDYTEKYPRVGELRFSIGTIERDIKTLLSVKTDDQAKLTQALGRLMVRRSELETELWKLSRTLADEHPEIKRAKRRVAIFDKAIKSILE